ncbi:unnamed protein product [Haemonchus placei]|uniref:Uncharacterized protein n=1 Tax=Haemonchus placei TaxID=6290 RepID=A0A0N4XB60_HAEPC|nr:unnamed protein product [Haemonchus placei]
MPETLYRKGDDGSAVCRKGHFLYENSAPPLRPYPSPFQRMTAIQKKDTVSDGKALILKFCARLEAENTIAKQGACKFDINAPTCSMNVADENALRKNRKWGRDAHKF